MIKCKEAASLYPQYSEPWIVFDRDQVSNFDDIIEDAKRNKVNAGWSNPCLEIWFFAYFDNMPNIYESVSCCNKFVVEYAKRTGLKYDKAELNIYEILNKFGDEEKAIKIAEAKRNRCLDMELKKPSEMIPCTTLDILVNEIKDKIKNK